MKFQHMLGKVGLTTRGELDQVQARKEIWHSLVRDVFARYYLKMREAFPDQLPDLPRKYSPGWEDHIKNELGNFLETDLQDVDPLLRACGFGTEKWQQFVEETLPEMDAIVDSHLSGDYVPNGHVPGTDEELAQELREARKEIRQLRGAGRRALNRLKDYERQIEELRQNGHAAPAATDNGESFTALFPDYANDEDNADDEDDYRTDDDATANGNPTDLFAEQSPTADEDAAEFFADDEPAAQPENTGGPFVPDELSSKSAARPQTTGDIPTDEEWVELQRQNEELRGRLALREKKIDALNNQLDDLEEDIRIVPRAERLNDDDEDDLRSDGKNSNQELFELQRRYEHLQRDLNAKDQTIKVLRERIGDMERQMGLARDQLLAEVKKLDQLTSGKLELKPSSELEDMQAEELLEYAQEVAGDIDVRRQTLDEGLKGVSTLQDNYEENRKLYEQQQLELEEQLEKMASDLEEYQQKMTEAEEAAAEARAAAEEAGEEPPDQTESAELLKVVSTQRDQLQMLSERIKELQNSNKELQGSNHKMYKDLDTAVKRLIPLRGQIEELENLRDALSSYIRNKYDRTFTIRKMQEGG